MSGAVQDLLVIVEGGDDAHFVQHFVRLTTGQELLAGKSSQHGDGYSGMLKRVGVIGQETGYRNVGFLCDADADPKRRWRELRSKLGDYLPEDPVTIGVVVPFVRDTKLGLWMMPGNGSGGDFEAFLGAIRSNAAPQPQLWKKSISAVASIEHPLFADKDAAKAELRTWLAWQKEPGASPGVAVTMDCFDLTHPLAVSMADWFRRLLPTPAVP